MSDNTKPNLSKQRILADHIYQLHDKCNKVAVQTWRSLMREEVTETQLADARQIITEMEERIQYAKNCIWWIQTEITDNQAKATNGEA